ncbi:MAG: hypothetical protein GXP45_08030 [bacterium]|nr:hypothetical protein [bacterium]
MFDQDDLDHDKEKREEVLSKFQKFQSLVDQEVQAIQEEQSQQKKKVLYEEFQKF